MGVGLAIAGSAALSGLGFVFGGRSQSKAAKQQANLALATGRAAAGVQNDTLLESLRALNQGFAGQTATQQSVLDQQLLSADEAFDASLPLYQSAHANASHLNQVANEQTLGALEHAWGEAQGYRPYAEAGRNALANLTEGNFEASPGYQWRLKQGADALEASAAARGGLNSGATGQALVQHGQDYGSLEYDNWFGRNFGLAQQGMNATGALTGAADRRASGIGASVRGTADRAAAMDFGLADSVAGLHSARSGAHTNALSAFGAQRGGTIGDYAVNTANAHANRASGTTNALTGQASQLGQAYANQGNAAAAMYGGIANSANSGVTNYLGYNMFNNLLAKQGETSRASAAAATIRPPANAFADTALNIY